jgi:hypothetical protein
MISHVSSKHTVFKVRIIIIFALSHPLSRRVQATISFNLIHRRMFTYCNYEFILLIVGIGVCGGGMDTVTSIIFLHCTNRGIFEGCSFLTDLKYLNTVSYCIWTSISTTSAWCCTVLWVSNLHWVRRWEAIVCWLRWNMWSNRMLTLTELEIWSNHMLTELELWSNCMLTDLKDVALLYVGWAEICEAIALHVYWVGRCEPIACWLSCKVWSNCIFAELWDVSCLSLEMWSFCLLNYL